MSVVHRYSSYIAGSEESTGNSAFTVTDPADGSVVAEVSVATPVEIRRAVDAASAALESWSATPADMRGEIIRAAASIMRSRIDLLAETLTREQGKPLPQAVGELNYGIGFLDWFAEEGRRAYGLTVPGPSAEKRVLVLRRPVGVVAAITPWNFPAAQLLRKVGAALAAGCTVVAKPAELTPLSAIEIARAFGEAGLPQGVLSVVCAPKPHEFADEIMRDPRVRAVTFTGSTEVGKILARASADTMKRVSLELGGHAPVIVFDDANLDLAVRETLATKVRNMGQTCVAANRIYVHESVHDEFAARLASGMKALRLGNGRDPSVDVGPLVAEEAVIKIEQHVADAIQRGAKLQLGGGRASGLQLHSRLYFEPTILTDVDDSMLIANEETFGPVAPLLTFADDDEVIARANDTRFGLAAYFFTDSLRRAVKVAERLDYGTVGVNDATTAAVQAPFGGFKESGVGKEGGALGLDEFLDTQYVSIGDLH